MTRAEMTGTIAGGVALLAAAVVLEPLLRVLSLVGLFVPDKLAAPVESTAIVPPSPASFEGPERDERGFVECTRCSAFVPYTSMSLNEDGYFCRVCAGKLTATAVAANEPVDVDF